MSRRVIGVVAVATPFWFLAVYLIMAGMRPDYSYLTRMISELGSIHAPHRWFWNVLGFILPGLAIALLGAGLKAEFRGTGRLAVVPGFAIMASGLTMALSGIFSANMANMSAPTTIVHLTVSTISYVAFLIAGLWLPFIFRKHDTWRWLTWPSPVLAIASILPMLLVPNSAPGVAQRIIFACMLVWIALVGYGLMRPAASDSL